MRISDWSSDVCSSDLAEATIAGAKHRVLGEQIGQCVDRAVIDLIGIARDEIAQHEPRLHGFKPRQVPGVAHPWVRHATKSPNLRAVPSGRCTRKKCPPGPVPALKPVPPS